MRDLAEVCPNIAPGTTVNRSKPSPLSHGYNNVVNEAFYSLLYLLMSSQLICAGRILRSACPTAASEQDIDIIRHKLGISHLVSLRPWPNHLEIGCTLHSTCGIQQHLPAQ